MSGDREARALAAGDTITVEKNGVSKTYRLRPVVAQNLCDLEREALRHYKQQYLGTYIENAALIPDGQKLIQQKLEEVARWDLSNLPQKDAYDVSRIPLGGEVLVSWIIANYGELPETEVGQRAILLTALDTGKMTAEQMRVMTGKAPIQGRIRYDQWWVTASLEGMLSFISAGIRREHPELTKEEVGSWTFPKIAEAARIVESLTTASLGNTSA